MNGAPAPPPGGTGGTGNTGGGGMGTGGGMTDGGMWPLSRILRVPADLRQRPTRALRLLEL